MERYLCIHGHFYQPPRENPWLETVELQDSAAPYHDWNERITIECYAPNATARILDGQGRISEIVSNCSMISSRSTRSSKPPIKSPISRKSSG
jgi:alpha-amylase/alpha-mannosidase (GH57 family)